MDNVLKERLIRIAAIGRLLVESVDDRELGEMLEGLGIELCALSGVCDVCEGDGIHPGEDPDEFDGETPLTKCPTCFGSGMAVQDAS